MPPDQIIIFEMLSAEYGWTPDQIRSIAFEEVMAYIEIIRNKRIIAKNM